MKTSLFIANVISAILVLNFLLTNPAITGFTVAPQKISIDPTSPLGLAMIFIITTISLDIYCYLRSRKEW